MNKQERSIKVKQCHELLDRVEYNFDNLINALTGKPVVIKSIAEPSVYVKEAASKAGKNVKEIFSNINKS